jgi:hypothetical protein
MGARTLVIRRVQLWPLAQWGFIAGMLIACAPALICSWLLFTVMATARSVLSSWRDVGLTILGQRISFNLLEMMSLQGPYERLGELTAWGVFGMLAAALALALGLGVFGGAVLAALGAFYNATGRLKLEVEEEKSNAVSD